MTEIVVNEGRHGAVAAVALEAGDCVVIDSAGKYALATDGTTAHYVMVVLKKVAAGVRVAAEQRKGYEVYAKVIGATDVAVGDLLEVSTTDGALMKAAGTNPVVAVALQAYTDAAAALKKVMLL